MRKYIVILVLLFQAVVGYAQVKVTASLDTTQILIGGRSHYSITVYAPKGARISFPDYKEKKEIVPNVEVLNEQTDTFDTAEGNSVRRVYTITAWKDMRYTLPAQKVSVDGKTKMTGSVSLDVRSIPVDTVNNAMMPPDDIQKVPFTWSEWVSVILPLLLALVFIGVSFYLYKRQGCKKKGWKGKKAHVLSFYEQAKQELSEIAKNKTSYSEQKLYYTDVTNVLRKYISQRFGINALEQTSYEILERLKDVCKSSEVDDLREVFNTVDLVKFAKYSTNANDMDFYLDSIVRFIDCTKKEEPVEVVVEPTKDVIESGLRRRLRFTIGLLIVVSILLLLYAVSEAYVLLV